MKYIFVTGAPGSRWSGYVEDHLYVRDDIDKSDFRQDREYKVNGQVMHRGAYFDSGMEFNNFPQSWDLPFDKESVGIRVIKSHLFAYQLDWLTQFKDDIHIVYRPDQECFDWWHEAGGWDISWPNYGWYENNEKMREEICCQNRAILEFVYKHQLPLRKPGHEWFRNTWRVDRDFIFEKDVWIAEC